MQRQGFFCCFLSLFSCGPSKQCSYPNVPTKSEQNTNKENVILLILINLIQSSEKKIYHKLLWIRVFLLVNRSMEGSRQKVVMGERAMTLNYKNDIKSSRSIQIHQCRHRYEHKLWISCRFTRAAGSDSYLSCSDPDQLRLQLFDGTESQREEVHSKTKSS